jgi:hypothetical protein
MRTTPRAKWEGIDPGADLWIELALARGHERRIAEYLRDAKLPNPTWIEVLCNILAGTHYHWVARVHHDGRGRPPKEMSTDMVLGECIAKLHRTPADIETVADLFDPRARTTIKVTLHRRASSRGKPARPVREAILAAEVELREREVGKLESVVADLKSKRRASRRTVMRRRTKRRPK